jgi:hypothetical protein
MTNMWKKISAVLVATGVFVGSLGKIFGKGKK